jgi:sugar O-acyltransferase (sialic acid O-acetyltransferase NeuD family)
METFTFLGHSNNSLSMFIEILVSLYGNNFTIEIVNNIPIEDETPFMPNGIITSEHWHNDFVWSSGKNYLIGVNQPLAKKSVFDFFRSKASIQFTSYRQLVHPGAIISSTSTIGNGVIINPGCISAPFSQLGNLITVNRNVTIGHHTTIDDFTTINPGVNIAGHCTIGKGVTIGIGANIIDGITVGENAVIGAGSLVTRDVPSNVVVYGVPAKEKSGI